MNENKEFFEDSVKENHGEMNKKEMRIKIPEKALCLGLGVLGFVFLKIGMKYQYKRGLYDGEIEILTGMLQSFITEETK